MSLVLGMGFSIMFIYLVVYMRSFELTKTNNSEVLIEEEWGPEPPREEAEAEVMKVLLWEA